LKTILWILVGILIGILSWVPASMADPHDIIAQLVIIAWLGSLVGAVIVITATVNWIRHGS
jgi:hypothetical protein